jgi:hypothetical protein
MSRRAGWVLCIIAVLLVLTTAMGACMFMAVVDDLPRGDEFCTMSEERASIYAPTRPGDLVPAYVVSGCAPRPQEFLVCGHFGDVDAARPSEFHSHECSSSGVYASRLPRPARDHLGSPGSFCLVTPRSRTERSTQPRAGTLVATGERGCLADEYQICGYMVSGEPHVVFLSASCGNS